MGGPEKLPAWSLGPSSWRGETTSYQIYLPGIKSSFVNCTIGFASESDFDLSGSQAPAVLPRRRGCETSQDCSPSLLISLMLNITNEHSSQER